MSDPKPTAAAFPNEMQTLSDFQAFHSWLDQKKGWNEDLNYLTVLLTGELGEVAQVVKKINWRVELITAGAAATPADAETPAVAATPAVAETLAGAASQASARAAALAEYRAALGSELADCLAYLCKIANRSGVDLHQAYVQKMAYNVQRVWVGPDHPKDETR